MSREWIDSLAEQVKDKGREPAEEYAREQRRAGIIVAEGKVFFMALVQRLEQDLAEIRSRLQGSSVSCETSLVRESPTQVQLHRERFPWFDASLKHHEMEIVLEYARGRGVAGWGDDPGWGGAEDGRALRFRWTRRTGFLRRVRLMRRWGRLGRLRGWRGMSWSCCLGIRVSTGVEIR